MYIKSLAAKNTVEGWELEEVVFDYNLTLLVGISGAGKTQILRSINNLKVIVDGISINGFEWDVVFELNDEQSNLEDNKQTYRWQGSFAAVDLNVIIEEEDYNRLLKEKITVVGKEELIVDRTEEKAFFEGKEMPKLPKGISTINILREEGILSKMKLFFTRITLKDNTNRSRATRVSSKQQEFLGDYKGKLSTLRDSKVDGVLKFFIAIKNKMLVAQEIEGTFRNVFKEIEEIGVQPRSEPSGQFYDLELLIKPINSKQTIHQDKMSSGMLRFLSLLIDLYLSPDGSIFLIDEVENSLGINCLEDYIHNLQHANREIQIIATSHHPYIINNIPYQQWKIVKRKGAKITVEDAEDLGIGQSRQDAFIQLNKILRK